VIVAHTLVILRHAKSDWPDGVPDLQRPLGERGIREAPLAGQWLRDQVPPFDLVVRSPALRARQTWELAAAELGYEPLVREDARLYGEPVSVLLDVIRDIPPEAGTVLFVGHNPELNSLVTVLSGTAVELKTSSIAVLTFDGAWADVDVDEGTMQLEQVVTPRPE
jgi:phosphohistidine phosphatase